MRAETTFHVPASRLWQCACGSQDLPQRDYEHLIACPACENLINEIAEALDDIAHHYPAGKSGSWVS